MRLCQRQAVACRANASKYFDYSNSSFSSISDGFSFLGLFIFVIRNKNEPKNARPAKLAR